MTKYSFAQLVDMSQVRYLLESNHRITGMAYAVFDSEENKLIAVGWQDICTKFHCVHPVCSVRCRESDAYIKAHLANFREDCLEYRCKNGMIDVAVPIIIDGEHLASFFMGQFFYEDEKPDPEFFRTQAEEFGFDVDDYFEALQNVPIFNREHIRCAIRSLSHIVNLLVELGMQNLKLVHKVNVQKRLEKELFAAKKMETIVQITEGLANEVRNPLNAILSISEALFREKEIAENPEYLPYVQHIRTQVGRLSKLMADLLDLGKPVKPTSIQPVLLNTVCLETVILWNISELSRSHPLEYVCDFDTQGLWVHADGVRLQQVLLNLVENAARHSPPWSGIALQIEVVNGNRVVVRVRDSGKGIAKETIERVFEPLFTTRSGGPGLGLGLVKHIVESMGGEVKIRNNVPSPGCTVELILDIAGETGEGGRRESLKASVSQSMAFLN